VFRIRYAPRFLVDSRGDKAPIRSYQQTEDTFARHAKRDAAFRQAVSDLHHGKIVLGIETESKGKVVVDAIVLHVALEKAREEMRILRARGVGEKVARQIAIRELKR